METEIVIAPFDPKGHCYNKTSVFLAGTIDMGNSVDWQKWAIAGLEGKVEVIFNPRRPNWDLSWEQTAQDPNTSTQIRWELFYLSLAKVKAFYFAKDSKAPVSFLELGLSLGHGPCIVYCPEGFYRKANVDITCEGFAGAEIYEDEAEWLAALITAIQKEKVDSNWDK